MKSTREALRHGESQLLIIGLNSRLKNLILLGINLLSLNIQ